jgi:hypothetical protein
VLIDNRPWPWFLDRALLECYNERGGNEWPKNPFHRKPGRSLRATTDVPGYRPSSRAAGHRECAFFVEGVHGDTQLRSAGFVYAQDLSIGGTVWRTPEGILLDVVESSEA